MLHALGQLDFNLLWWAANLTANHAWLQPVVYFCAQILILTFPIPLWVLWHWPELHGEHHSAQKAVMLAMIAAVCTFALKAGLNFLYVRPRPFITHPSLPAMTFSLDPGSFPSGHTMVAFAVAVSLLLSGYRKLGWALIVLAILVGLGRVFAGVHYPSDVIVGALLGSGIAFYLHREASTIKRYLPNH